MMNKYKRTDIFSCSLQETAHLRDLMVAGFHEHKVTVIRDGIRKILKAGIPGIKNTFPGKPDAEGKGKVRRRRRIRQMMVVDGL